MISWAMEWKLIFYYIDWTDLNLIKSGNQFTKTCTKKWNDQDDVPVVTKYTIIKNVHINWLPILSQRGKGK